MAIRTGDYDQPAMFFRGEPQRLPSGAFMVPSEGMVCRAWVKMLAVSAGEQFSAGAVTLVSTHELRTPRQHNLSGDMKVMVNGAFYEVDGPPMDPDGRREELRMMVHPCTTR